jgi:hypothetical protein
MKRRTTLFAAAAVLAIASVIGLGAAVPAGTAGPAQAPVNTERPTISDTTPQAGQTLTADRGQWTGAQPMVFTYQWLRCNSGGRQCVPIPGAADRAYTASQDDVGDTLRVRVTARNAAGTGTADSAATSRVAAAPPTPGVVPVTAVNPPDRLLIDQVQFNPNPIRSATAPVTVRVKVLDTRGRTISGALVFLRSTPVVTTTPPEGTSGADGWATFTITPERDFRIVFRPGYNLQFFIRARKPGDNPLAGVSTRRLVQVRLSPA